MKHMLTFLMAAGLFLMSCGQQEDEPAGTSLEVSPKTLNLDPQGGQETLTIRSSEDWLVRTEARWLKVMNSSGQASSSPVAVKVNYDVNLDGAAREAVLTVKTLSGKAVDVTLKQAKFEGALAKGGIATADDLLAFAQTVNEGGSLFPFMTNGVVVLLNDIDASSIKDWTPAGTAANPFTGVFDGRDHVIRNISWSVDLSKYPDAGIIGYAKNASISNLDVGATGNTFTMTGTAQAVNAGAVVGKMTGGSVTNCTNSLDFVYAGTASGQNVCLAGICGASSGATVTKCINKGKVLSPVVCRAAGFVAYNEGPVTECTNRGYVLAEKSGEIGPAWACSYNKTPSDFKANIGRGYVDSYSLKDNLEAADSDAYLNAVVSPAKEGYDMAEVTVDITKPSYYDWTEVKSMQLSAGVKYTHYNCDNVPRHVHIIEVDLTDPAIEVTTSFANDCVPNPNGNKNSNNGFKIRETLSQLCARKRSEGQNIIAGINTGFFDSNDGIARGFHIEEGQPVYINNPAVVTGLPNHSWGFTVFTDGTAACGKKKFTGKLKVAETEFEWCSLNDTIMRNVSKSYQINLYNSRYKRYPHAAHTNLENKLAKNALYVVAEYVDAPMTVNNGYAAAKVISISDGRSSALSLAPYITSDKQIGIALSGAKADSFKSLVSVGSTVEFRCDMTIEGETTRPIYTQNSTMYHMMKDGVDNMSSVGSSASLHSTQDPLTFPVISQDKKKVWLVEVDGRQGWYSTGVTGNEMVQIAKKLGGYNMTRFDGGGSSTVWIYDAAKGVGSVVNSVSDSKGERSCMNYLLIKAK